MQTLSKPLAPLSLILILLLSGLTPLAVADSGRADPNFEIAACTLADAGSINLNGVVEAEAATHVVRIQVRNIGLGGGDADLSLLLQGTASSGDVVLGTTNLGFIGAGAHSQVTLFSWTATLGANQILKARVSSTLDPDPSNDEDQKIVNVSRYQNSSIHTRTYRGTVPPGQRGGSQTAHDFTVKVLNTGVMDQNAKVYLNFTEVGGSGAFSVESLPQPAIQPGSIHTVATPQDITVSVDATSRSGEWDLVGEVHITGQANFEETLPLLSTRVIFSNYDFELTPLITGAFRQVKPPSSRLSLRTRAHRSTPTPLAFQASVAGDELGSQSVDAHGPGRGRHLRLRGRDRPGQRPVGRCRHHHRHAGVHQRSLPKDRFNHRGDR